ncbi:DMT family transporter [Aestuariibius sp. HNIBRBA575]|uniref:DMT family transporter n=1 Tax=Aestuariibius sp. HNIBRBA575 TaxID=3233343 RepID=UPI0034A29A6B
MVAAMTGFAVEDAFLKATFVQLPIGQILMMFGLGGAILFAIVARLQGTSLLQAAVLSKPMRIRVLFEITGRLFYGLAITLTPLSSATVILQATPIVVVAGASIAFGEHVGWRRWLAIVIGLIGVLIILRPTSDSFSMLSILAVLGMLGFAGRDLASRAAPSTLSTSVLGFYGFLAVIVAGGLYALWDGQAFVMPHLRIWAMMIGAVVAGVLAYSGLMKAMRTGDVSAVTPFRYSRLLIGIAFGVLFFGETLDWQMAQGCVLIVLSGLFILWRSPSKPR